MRVLCLFLLVFPVVAWGHGFEFRFTEPTQRVDGTVFDPVTEVESYSAQCALDEAFTAPVEVFFPRSASSDNGDGRRYYYWQDAVQVGGWYFCRMSVADVNGLVSDWSNVATVRKVARPNPPVISDTR